jgi:hydroxymethylpyrimidine pyrophosphatase-like HAD family hydrolase
MLEAYSRHLNIQGPLIAVNGAVVYDTRTDMLPYFKAADKEAAYTLLEYCKKWDLDHIAATAQGYWYGKNSRRVARFEWYNQLAASCGLPLILLHRFGFGCRGALESDIYKILVSGLDPEEQRRTTDYVESLDILFLYVLGAGVAGCFRQKGKQGEGMKNLCRIFGLEKRQVCAFGDYWNDIPNTGGSGTACCHGKRR